MPKRRKNKKESEKDSTFDLQSETKYSVAAIIFFALGIFLLLAALGKAGVAGSATYSVLQSLFGVAFYLLPLISFFMGVSLFRANERPAIAARVILGSVFLLVSGLGLANILADSAGGLIGGLISGFLIQLFETTTSIVIFGALAVISLLIIFDTVPKTESFLFWKRFRKEAGDNETDEDVSEALPADFEDEENMEEEDTDEQEEGDDADTPEDTLMEKHSAVVGTEPLPRSTEKRIAYLPKPFVPPPLSLLERDRGKPGVGDIKANATIIKRTLQNFGINVEMDEISIGPSVTRYAFKPAEGVKLSRIVGLQNDLSLALAAHPLRIEAPIPGKSLVGIEIPNTTKITVGLGSLLSSPEYETRNEALLFSLGKDISGHVHFTNLGKMPHLLIAGATGSGKSVMIHTFVTSLLYRNAPEHLKFILIDPKRVELTLYNKIPNLLTPVITNPKKAILALKWAAKEMDRRYDILETESVRDIDSYHKNILAPALKASAKGKTDDIELPETMPYVVIIIDELADIMIAYPRELESSIVRLAQMARAVGIHLVLSTQRPSVNVITGLIKANIPARIAFQVASQIDSRTILDAGGAEKLLGAGDMLFLSGDMAKPRRIQSAFISEGEVKSVVKYLAQHYERGDDAITLADETGGGTLASVLEHDRMDDGEDDLFEDARAAVISAGKASTSYLQRKLKVGYARAARLIDALEERGIVGPADGAKPREVLVEESNQIASYDTFSREPVAENESPTATDRLEADNESGEQRL
ncbi:MAG: cell division protein FtsK [Candidatus Lloydbacteria bacterium CG22_combo_CG10-13_8_21_14_all_47_15]|uniref:Cell division protein FtsK n=1 Tax=Candidatus Lloydbacteria bacterium CG22_combo_CG10-13_8_21_14_all_47_15 TaxID=1974635 RepID=A0A2H0CVQ8_9BACT|nr:MAG: cell division protein FtsK [Candidatus Lloydbacteria bacterium CG22_combo_CG10-13_8_21_14_all_47_15]